MDILSGTVGSYRKLMLAWQFWESEDMDALEEYVDICAKMNRSKIVLDLDRLTFINSQALGLIVRLHMLCKDAGGKLILFQPQSSVKEVIEVTGLGEFMAVATTSAELEREMV